MHSRQETPDVLDVRVRERVVVPVPVHPAPQAPVLARDHLPVLGNAFAAASGELGEAVLLDVPLRVEAERLFHLDLDPQALAVEAVLVALVEAAQRLVALEDVLERPPPGVVHAHGIVRGDRAVDEAEALAALILGAQLLERSLGFPAFEHLPLERRVIGDTRKWREHARHGEILRREAKRPRRRLGSRKLYKNVFGEKASIMESVTAETFEAEVVNSETPVLVDFWAEWCGPCHAVAPVLERIAEERPGELKIVKLNIDEEQDLALRYGVMSIPTMILFRDGEPAAALSGAHPKGAIERALGLEQVAA